MAAPRARLLTQPFNTFLQSLHLMTLVWNKGARGIRGLSSAVTPEGSQRKKTLLQFLYDHFQEGTALKEYLLRKQLSKVQQKNRFFPNIKNRYGPDIAGAYFILKLGGSVKFRGKEWMGVKGPDQSFDIMKLREVPVEAVDATSCVINYQGLDNLLGLQELQSLTLQRCPYVDDWCLSRLYQLADSLQELSLAGCPQVSERGLACLHHLQNLRRLDISNLPAVSDPGLTQILVEEMLPNCEVVGVDWAQGLDPRPEDQRQDTASPIPAYPSAPFPSNHSSAGPH